MGACRRLRRQAPAPLLAVAAPAPAVGAGRGADPTSRLGARTTLRQDDPGRARRVVGLPAATDLDGRVRPGDRRYAVCVATSLRQARLFVQAAASIVQASPLLRGMVESITDDMITFRNGTALTAFPCIARGVRGWPISTCHRVTPVAAAPFRDRLHARGAPSDTELHPPSRPNFEAAYAEQPEAGLRQCAGMSLELRGPS